MYFIPLDRKKLEIKQKLSNNSTKNNKDDFNIGVQKGVDESFEFFAYTICLFKKYKNNVKLLMEEQKDVWLKWVKYYENHKDIKNSNYLETYNQWLFDYAFSNINNEKSSVFFDI